MGTMLAVVDLASPAKALSAGWEHTCAILDGALAGAVKCWGSNNNGALGLGDVISRGTDPVTQMGASLPVVPLGEAAVIVRAGFRTTCAILASGKLKCWGYNGFGQLGVGDNLDRGDSPGEVAALPGVDL